MNSIFKKTLIAVSCSAALFLTACNSDDKDDYKPVVEEKTFLSEADYYIDNSLNDLATIKVMKYNMQNVQGKTAETAALVLFPKTPQPKDGWRVVVWEHGTLGVADACAPTTNTLGVRFKDPLAKSLLEAGYVIVAPDYEGLGERGIHPYLHLESEAKSAIAAVKAAQDHYGAKLNKQWMSVGQSQGGQASLGTAEFANNDVNYKGAVAGAPASNLDKIIFDVAPTALSDAEEKELSAGLTPEQRVNGSIGAYSTLLSYAAFAAVGVKASEPNFNYRAIFKAESTGAIAAMAEGGTGENGLCLDSKNPETHPEESLRYHFTQDIVQFLKKSSDNKLEDYPGLDKEKFYASPEILAFIKASQPGTKKIDKPIMIIQGTADMSVPYPVTKALSDSMKKMGTDVEFITVVGASHTAAIVEKNPELVVFIKKHMPAQ